MNAVRSDESRNVISRLRFVVLAAAMVGAGVTFAETGPGSRAVQQPQTFSPNTASISPEVKQKILDHMKQTNLERLKGWPGIIFYCPVDEETNPALKAVCSAVNADVGGLMSEHKIPFQIAKSAFDTHFLPHMSGRLLLVVELVGTAPEVRPSAVAAEVKALAHYAHAVNWSSELYPESPSKDNKSPLEVPQHIDAMLWESNQIVSATGDQLTLVDQVKAGVEERLKNFLGEIDRVNRKH